MLGPGSYINAELLLDEIARTGIHPSRLVIDENAILVTEEDRDTERDSGIGPRLGSTCSGTGAAVVKRISRRSRDDLAIACVALQPYIGDVPARLRELVSEGSSVLVEGTQGFGLSLLHAREFPKTTTRDTSAAGATSEAGLSPLDVSDVVLVLRSFPIRVAGDSGGFGAEEIDWETIASEGGHSDDLTEYTSVTQRVRRVARFDPALVRRAIMINQPSTIVLNHVDYIDDQCTETVLSPKAREFVRWVEDEIGRRIDYVGLGPTSLVPRKLALARAA